MGSLERNGDRHEHPAFLWEEAAHRAVREQMFHGGDTFVDFLHPGRLKYFLPDGKDIFTFARVTRKQLDTLGRFVLTLDVNVPYDAERAGKQPPVGIGQPFYHKVVMTELHWDPVPGVPLTERKKRRVLEPYALKETAEPSTLEKVRSAIRAKASELMSAKISVTEVLIALTILAMAAQITLNVRESDRNDVPTPRTSPPPLPAPSSGTRPTGSPPSHSSEYGRDELSK